MAEQKITPAVPKADPKERFKAARDKIAAANGRPKPQAYRADDAAALPPKVMLYGPSGTGKTMFIVGLLQAGEVVFVVSTDFGSNGLITVRNALRKAGQLDLLKNLHAIDMDTYEDVEAFFTNPTEFVPDFYTLGFTVLAWEGYSSFTGDIVDEYVLSHQSSADAGELRQAGLTHLKQDWQGIKRGSIRSLRKFIGFRLPDGKHIAKYLTALEAGSSDFNDLTGKTEKGPLVVGAAKKLMAPGFDVIINTYSEEDKDGMPQFFYRCAGASGKHLVKSRGYDLKPVEPADPLRIWKHIRAIGGGKAEELPEDED